MSSNGKWWTDICLKINYSFLKLWLIKYNKERSHVNYEIQTEIQMYLHWQRLKTKKQQQKKMYQGCSEEKNGILIPFGSISNNLSMT